MRSTNLGAVDVILRDIPTPREPEEGCNLAAIRWPCEGGPERVLVGGGVGQRRGRGSLVRVTQTLW